MRKTFLQVYQEAQVDNNKKLTVDGHEIGLVYYRTGYQADHYMMDEDEQQQWDERKWQARTMLECSLPIKCPSIDLHLATFKKYQQSFAEESVLRGISGSD